MSEYGDGWFVFCIRADYRKNNPDKPKYYVIARSKAEAKRKFKDKISWLDIYDITVLASDEGKDFIKKYNENPFCCILIH